MFLKVTPTLAQKWRKWVPGGCKTMCQDCEATAGLVEKQTGAQEQSVDFALYVKGKHHDSELRNTVLLLNAYFSCQAAFPLPTDLTLKSTKQLQSDSN